MTDEDALIDLALGDDAEKARAREHLADAYVGPLMVIFRRIFEQEDIADRAALGAIARLTRVAESRVEHLPTASGLKNWLVKAGRYAALDARRMDLGRQEARVDGLDDQAEEVDSPSTEFDEPALTASAAELARVVLAYILGLDQPARGILLFDAYGQIQDLTNEEIDLHDDELIDCMKPYGVWSRDALRSHRTRARRELREHLIAKGFTP